MRQIADAATSGAVREARRGNVPIADGVTYRKDSIAEIFIQWAVSERIIASFGAEIDQ